MKRYVFIMAFLLLMPASISTCKAAIPINSKVTLSKTSLPKVIHVFVALCDNKYQGIVPVPAKLGNGQDIENNLYWGGKFGVRSYFKRSKEWKLIKAYHLNNIVLERLVFKHQQYNYYLVADAYDGRYIKQATIDLLNSCSGEEKNTFVMNGETIGINGRAVLLAYIGHDGLMDFKLSNVYNNKDDIHRDCIILACVSKKYFSSFINQTKSNPIIWSTGLMCPEAYTLHDAISSYIEGKSTAIIRKQAATTYNLYQKCGLPFADRLLVSGW